MYNVSIPTKTIISQTLEELLERFTKRGGTVNRFYLQTPARNRKSLVYLKGWYTGANIKDAIVKALAGQQ
jgi:hypothetical protein